MLSVARDVTVVWVCLVILFVAWWQTLPWEDDDDDWQ